MKRLFAAAVLAFAFTTATAVHAHGEAKAKQGGVVTVAGDLVFELVVKPEGAVVYVEDHGKPFATAGMSGKLTVLKGTEKSEGELKAAGDNRLEASGVKLAKGARAVATVTTTDKKTLTVRFTVK
jgi:hypothetical protein